MPEPFTLLLDQNVPQALINWIKNIKPKWFVHHTSKVGLDHKSDEEIFQWAQVNRAAIVTFDEDFADQRSFRVVTHHGIIRLRIWPTTLEETKNALSRLFSEVNENDFKNALIIVDRTKIRLRLIKK